MSSRVLRTGENQITQGFKTTHKGLDIVKYKSQLDDIIAHSDGTVIMIQTGQKNNKLSTGNKSYGNFVKIDHGNDYCTLYAHLADVRVSSGQKVKKGTVLGRMGNTGRSYGAHLHFELFENGKKIDPTPYIDKDLPFKPHATYRVYTNKWWSEVVDCNDKNSNGYAGVNNQAMTALCAKSNVGTLKYRVHLVGGEWLSWVSAYDINDSKKGYAGIKGSKIDAVQMTLEGTDKYAVQYRVSPANNKKWYGWCTNLNDRTGDGYAGVMGTPIDCIQVKIVAK